MNKNILSYEEIMYFLKQEIKTGPYAHMTFEEKFWLQVNIKSKNECWEFTKHLYSNGYGMFNISYRSVLAHRLSYMIHYGKIPDNKIIMHSCDNRKCVNPFHLSAGTQSENVQDMLSKGRDNFSKGTNHFRCKLDDNQIKEIIDARKKGIPGKELSEKYNVSCPQIYRVANGKRRNNANK